MGRKTIGLSIFVAAVLALSAVPALAQPGTFGESHGKRQAYEQAGHRGHGYRAKHWRRPHHSYGHHYRGRQGPLLRYGLPSRHRYGHRQHRYRPAYKHRRHFTGYGCHKVSRIDYHHGRRARIGGVLCYDAHGRAFILPGSRYVIGYLY